MESLSAVFGCLYEAATRTEPKNFIPSMIRVVRQAIVFDGAFYGVGLLDPYLQNHLVIERGYVYQREDSFLNDYMSLSNIDPVVKKVIASKTPFYCSPEDYYGQYNLHALQKFAARYRINNLLIHGQFPVEEATGRWLAFFREANNDFDNNDASTLNVLWPHLLRAVRINLYYALHNTDPQKTSHASGLINSYGIAEIADPAFFPLLKLEWPEDCKCSIPKEILSAVLKEGIYYGQQVDLCGMPHFGYLMCVARKVTLNTELSPMERKVAHYFAQGMTNKEIGLKLGTSPHTVRVQLKSVYRKLGVHKKIDLSHAIR
jgi:DNA-binding CsgD family transcriptional regulator